MPCSRASAYTFLVPQRSQAATSAAVNVSTAAEPRRGCPLVSGDLALARGSRGLRALSDVRYNRVRQWRRAHRRGGPRRRFVRHAASHHESHHQRDCLD